MVLDSPRTCTAALHQHGKTTIRTLSQASTAYRTARTREEEPVIPSPAVFAFDRDAGRADDARRLPPVAACAAHLQLLEVFYVLRQRILVSEDIDAAMGIAPQREVKVGRHGDRKVLRDDTLWDRRQQKWTKFVEFAAVRFLAWRRALRLREGDMTAAAYGRDGRALACLPPLDVVMVWHAFMLNPRLFRQTCQDELLYSIAMPWQAVHVAIDGREWTFAPGRAAEAHFEAVVGVPADLLGQFTAWTKQHGAAQPPPPGLDAFGLAGETGPEAVFAAAAPGSMPAYAYAALFRSVDGPLATALRDAVARQADFVDKMNAHMWIRSPALEGTLRRAVDRYARFLELLRLRPDTTIVPTLDIDLVWHTHQCGAAAYARAMRALVGHFVNHDDTIVKERLGTGFDASQRLFQVHFGRQYRVCGCWDCEALLSALEDAARAGPDADVDMAAVARRARDDVTYYRAVEVAIRGKKPLPVRR
ncbi:Glycine-rich domain-containing protein 2 [Tolypocladium ophioglossoides CBS 100239]|uniref:Glycine-rich domain-containing protein 2 n=1 Tax=Tolypocladium ophioglossoides (strain CBS 100239) TaxID=1163406 RepID=A0A0L0N829_TOLOC|nr:Glycine-rich domain-containing protein 2 [Tolypocladium ophioglossoides CBS 100239]